MTLPELDAKHARQDRLALLVCACVLALVLTLLATVGPSDTKVAGASSHDFASWYAVPENRDWYHFQEWYGASPRNASYFHIRQHFGNGDLGDQAVRVAMCESDLWPRATSATNDHGVFQINRPSWERRFAEVTGQAWNPNVYHADANARFARWLHDVTGGWSHWACAR